MTIQELVRIAMEKGASDIFIVAGCPLSIKVNNLLERIDKHSLKKEDSKRLVDEIYALSNVHTNTTLASKGDDDFSFSIPEVARFRVNVFMQRGSLAAVLRIVRFDIPSAKELGIPDDILRFAKITKGLIIISGPAGSGKSSTLAVLLDEINRNRSVHIVTLEDPIEFLHRHNKSIVSQREISSDCESTASALRAALRQAPDVIFIGEMRDLDTISLAMTAAETGHLVFSTLHTLGAANTVDRIVDVFPPMQQQQVRVQLSMVLQAVISQQLLRTKTSNLVPVFEVMTNATAIKNQIREGKTHQLNNTIISSIDEGMVSMDSMILDLVRNDIVDETEALAHSFDPAIMKKRIKELR
jgi:twitching motility protein PilT